MPFISARHTSICHRRQLLISLCDQLEVSVVTIVWLQIFYSHLIQVEGLNVYTEDESFVQNAGYGAISRAGASSDVLSLCVVQPLIFFACVSLHVGPRRRRHCGRQERQRLRVEGRVLVRVLVVHRADAQLGGQR